MINMGMKFLKAVYVVYIYLTKFEFLTSIISMIGTYIYIYIWPVIKSLMLIFMFYTLKNMYITLILELITAISKYICHLWITPSLHIYVIVTSTLVQFSLHCPLGKIAFCNPWQSSCSTTSKPGTCNSPSKNVLIQSSWTSTVVAAQFHIHPRVHLV